MNYNILYTILFVFLAYAFFKIHKWWLHDRIKEKDSEMITFAETFRHWVIIISLVIAAIVNFFKAFY